MKKVGGRVWGHAPPRKICKIRHSKIASEAMFWAKKGTKISPSVVSV